eukprot:g8271.t1
MSGGSPGASSGGGGVGGDASKPVSARTQALWLFAWLVNNIGITMLNKYAFSKADFNYPLVTSAFHMLCNWLGTMVYFWVSGTNQQPVPRQHWVALIAFSVVFSLNISVGNISSSMVPVAFNQVMRSLVPVIVMVIGTQMFGKSFSRARKLAVVPIMVGVMMACYGDMGTFGVAGVLVTVFMAVMSGMKNVLSGEMLTGDIKMPPLQLLSRMAPLALVQMAVSAFAFGETADLASHWDDLKGGSVLYVVLATGIGSFSLNLCSLQANKVTSPLTLSIMANVKQVLIIAFGTIYFKDPTSTLNKIGFVVVVAASTHYSLLSVKERKRADAKPAEPPGNGSLPLLPK